MLCVAPALPVSGDDKSDAGNGVTIGRIASVLAEETGMCATLRAPADLPRGARDFEAFLAAGDFALAVALHAFKCGDALDALAELRAKTKSGVKTVLVLGGTDVNVDARENPPRAATLARRARAANVVVAFSPSMVAAAPRGALPPATTTTVPQGVRLPFHAASPTRDGESADRRGSEKTLHDALDVPSSTPVFLLPAGLRPVKDVLWAVDAAERAARCAAETKTEPLVSRGGGTSPSLRDPASACSEPSSRLPPPAFVLAVVGPALDEPYASLVARKARACSAERGGAGAFAAAAPVPRGALLAYARAAAGVVNTSLSEGQSGALLEAAAAGTPVFARDIPGNRALLDMLAEESAEEPAEESAEEVAKEPVSSPLARFPRLAACARPCGFLFAAPETLAEAMASFAEDSELGSAMRHAAGRAAARARRGAEALARREREGWRDIAAGLLATEKA